MRNEMQLPVRLKNRLEKFDYSRNGAYFITVCTKDREKFLRNIAGECPDNIAPLRKNR